MRDKSRVLLLTGAAGGGKSRCAAEKIHAYLKKYPGATGLMLRKAREWAGKSIVPFMLRTVIGQDPDVHINKSESCFVYANGSVLYWGGMRDDDQREALRSIGAEGALDIVWVEEANAFTEDDFNELLARLRGHTAPWRQIILTTNPDAPTHWIYTRLIQKGEASVYYSSAADNPANPPDYLETLDSLTGVLRARLRDGKWIHAEGAVYSDFSDDVHLLNWFAPPAEWRRIRAIDFGYTNPFVCQWWALDEDDRMVLYREIYMSQRLVEDHARLINAISCGMTLAEWTALDDLDQRALAAGLIPPIWSNLPDAEKASRMSRVERIEATVADHDAEGRATLEKYGISTTAAKKDIQDGIQAVQARFRPAGDGRPRIYIMRGALVEEDISLGKLPRSTLEEFPGYVWVKPREGQTTKETPTPTNDHGMDAMRYAVMYVDGPKAVLEMSANPFYG